MFVLSLVFRYVRIETIVIVSPTRCILDGEFDCDRSIAASSEESREARSRLLKLTRLRVIIAGKSGNLSDL